MNNSRPLGEYALHIAMGPFGSSVKRSTFVDKGIPIISGAHLHEAKLNESEGFNFITEEHANRHQNSIVKKGDVVFTAYGTIGQVSYVPENSNYDTYIASQRQFFLRPDPSILDPIFLTYYFRSREGRHLLLSNSSQVGVPSIASPTSFLKSLELPIPSIDCQKAVAHILATLDNKIELNRKTNKTLGGIAKALFKSWFVDFDPVRAKAEGRPTGLPDEISELFPDSFEESELGEIPSGWNVVGLSHYLLLQRGFDLPAKKRIKGAYPVVAASGISSSHNSPMAKAPGVVTGRSGVLGNVFYVQQDFFPLNTTLWAKEFYSATPLFGYFILGTIDFSAFNAGSAVPTLNRNHLGSLRFASPPDLLIRHFTKIAVPLMESLDLNSKQVVTLEQIRDAVLPRLISGELRVPDAEKMLEEVGV